MGYYIRPGIVDENQDLLEKIKALTELGVEAKFEAPTEDLYKLQYSIRRILKATEVLRRECDGKYADLGKPLTVKVDTEQSCIIVRTKKTHKAVRITPLNESDMIDFLKQFKGSLTPIEFHPSDGFSEEAYAEQLRAAGWKLHIATGETTDDGKRTYVVERLENERAMPKNIFDMIENA